MFIAIDTDLEVGATTNLDKLQLGTGPLPGIAELQTGTWRRSSTVLHTAYDQRARFPPSKPSANTAQPCSYAPTSTTPS